MIFISHISHLKFIMLIENVMHSTGEFLIKGDSVWGYHQDRVICACVSL